MSQKRDLREFRVMLKEAKKHLQRENLHRAEFYLQRANEALGQLPDEVRLGKQAFVWHRLAEAAAHGNEPMVATRRFREALKLANPSDELGYARIKRDYGEFLRRQGDAKAGRREVEAALEVIEAIESRTARVRFELIVTEGFIARFDLADPGKRDAAIATLHVVARKLRGYKKHQYELASLRCLIEILPLHSPRRIEYIRRAVILNLKLGNHKRAGEYLALLGGESSRGVYRFVVR